MIKIDDIGGVWRTVGGRRIFIRDGQSLQDAMQESGKFNHIDVQDDRHKEEREYIKENTGVSEEEAQEMYGAIAHYTTTSYDDIRDLSNNSDSVVKERENLEKYIEKAPKYEGEIYRGLSFRDDDFVNQLEVGKVMDMRGISSWSADKNVARAFSEAYMKKNQVVITMKNKTGVDISKISAIKEEKEVLQSSKTFYSIKSIDSKNIAGPRETTPRILWNIEVEEL